MSPLGFGLLTFLSTFADPLIVERVNPQSG